MRTAIRRRLLPIGAACAALTVALAGPQASAANTLNASGTHPHNRPHAISTSTSSPGGIRSDAVSGPPGDPDGGVDDPSAADNEYFAARSAPGVVAPGAYGAAWRQLQSLPHSGADWKPVTTTPYNSDDPRYRDYDSNSSGGSGNVTGRMAAHGRRRRRLRLRGQRRRRRVALRDRRRAAGRRSATRCPRSPPATLALDGSGRLWLGTGEATTNADAYLGSGVYVLSDPAARHVLHPRPGRRHRAGVHHHPRAALRRRHGLGGHQRAACGRHSTNDLQRRRGSWSSRPTPPTCPAVRWRTTTRRAVQEHRQRHRHRPEGPGQGRARASAGAAATPTTASTPRSGGTWTRITTSLGDLPTDADNVGTVTFARSADGSQLLRHQPVDPTTDHQPGQPRSAASTSPSRYAVRPVDADRRLHEAGRLRLRR